MGRPRSGANEVATRDRILAAATTEFARAGLHAARLEDIANQAGIQRPSLLYHFSTKEELYEEVVEHTFELLAKALERALLAQGTFEERLVGSVENYASFIDENPSLAAICLREVLDQGEKGMEILTKNAVPVVDLDEKILTETGAEFLRPGLPLRAAIMLIASDAMLRAVAGPLREPLWGSNPNLPEVARLLFLKDPTPNPES